jgi:hypothetical protein
MKPGMARRIPAQHPRGVLPALLVFCLTLGNIPAQTNFTTITANGPASNRVNLVILAEGYLASQLAQFQADATNVANLLLTNQPYAAYRSYFNVYAIAVASAQAGSDHPNNSQFVNTYFNSTYDGGDYFLSIPAGSTGQGKVDALVNTYLPRAGLVVLLVNDNIAGGSDAGGRTAVVSRGAAFGSLYSILAHETGHVFADLGDEYTGANPGYPDTEEPNTTRETNRHAIKWAAWIEPTTPVPTPPNSDNLTKVGLFEGAHYNPSGWYRPKVNCMMRSFGVGFCEVCTEALVLAMYRQVRPVESFSPTATNQFWTTTAPGNFQLQTVQPVGHALAYEWRTNGVVVSGATTASLTLFPSQLGAGLHTVAGRVYDPTPWVRTDPTNLLSQAMTWQVNVSLPQLQLVSPRRVGGKFAFGVTGVAPQGVVIQASTNLLNWTAMATGVLTGGQLNYTNPNPATLPRQFYRAITPP